MKNTRALTLAFGEKQIVLLARAMVQAMFDMVVNGKRPEPIDLPAAPPAIGVLPAIGTVVDGQICAGLTIEDNRPVVLWLLPGDEKMSWKDGVEWASKKGGVLPSRIDQLVLFKNLKKEFQEAWYWSGEQYEPGSGYAWVQYFSNGDQGYDRKDDTSRVRAVRRSVIQ
jgi:hypothetical protein